MGVRRQAYLLISTCNDFFLWHICMGVYMCVRVSVCGSHKHGRLQFHATCNTSPPPHPPAPPPPKKKLSSLSSIFLTFILSKFWIKTSAYILNINCQNSDFPLSLILNKDLGCCFLVGVDSQVLLAVSLFSVCGGHVIFRICFFYDLALHLSNSK